VISALVLAAGEGTRFGGTKQLEILRGKPLVQYAVDAASAAGVGEIVVVLGHDALRVRDALALPEQSRFVVNERYAQGQSTSLAAGLRALDAESGSAPARAMPSRDLKDAVERLKLDRTVTQALVAQQTAVAPSVPPTTSARRLWFTLVAVVVVLVGAAAWLGFFAVTWAMPAVSVPAIAGLFLLQFLVIWVRSAVRVAAWGSYLEFLDHRAAAATFGVIVRSMRPMRISCLGSARRPEMHQPRQATSRLYLMRCGWSAAVPSSLRRNAS